MNQLMQEKQIKFELFKIIQNNFTINKCENCGKLFIPVTTSKNKNQKGRNDQNIAIIYIQIQEKLAEKLVL